MATAMNPGDEVFLDSSYAIALCSPGNALHSKALRLARECEAGRVRLTTTRPCCLKSAMH